MVRRAALLGLFALLPDAGLGQGVQSGDPCLDIDTRFQSVITRYQRAGEAAIATQSPGDALDAARLAAIAGDVPATVTLVGVTLLFRARSEMFRLSEIRSICGFADRNRHPLHIVACAYFNALNPIGNREDKRAATTRELERLAGLPADAPFRDLELDAHARALEACIATRPP